ncbi:MAG: DapH/DapD/GlmU-related protein [Candidatus Hermodarchaeota archaeon]
MEKLDKDYFFWSLRAVIKKWPFWLTNLIPLPMIHNFVLKLLGTKTDYSNSISRGKIDSEFIELGRNVLIGQGCSIKSSMIVKGHLIINKVIIEDNVIIGSNSFIAPGTHIGSNTVLGTMSATKINQKLESNAVYIGNPVEKISNSSLEYKQNFKEMDFKNRYHQYNNLNYNRTEEKFVKNLSLNISTFGIIYFFSNLVSVLGIIYFFCEYFYPLFLIKPTLIRVFIDPPALLVFLLTPFFIIFLFLINLFSVILITKILYMVFRYKNPAKEGIFHWNNKNTDYESYFKRSFVLRYVKWKIQKSPFPWLIKPAFNFIGNCQFGKNTVIEDCFIAKEFLKVGSNSYLGKALLANHLWDKNLTIKSIIIGNNVDISDNCCIAPGTEIEDNVTVLPLFVTSKDDKLRSNLLDNFMNKIGDYHAH